MSRIVTVPRRTNFILYRHKAGPIGSAVRGEGAEKHIQPSRQPGGSKGLAVADTQDRRTFLNLCSVVQGSRFLARIYLIGLTALGEFVSAQ